MKIQEVIDMYIMYRVNLGEKARTIRFMLNNFGRYVGVNQEINQISQEECLLYLNTLGMKNGAATPYWFGIYTALNGFFTWAMARMYLSYNPLPKDKPVKPEAYIPYIYTNDELKRIFETALTYRKRFNIEYPEVIQMMLKITYCLGLRPSETTHLVMDDINLGDKVVYIRETKFYKSRQVPFNEEVSTMLYNFIQWRTDVVMERNFTDNHLFLDKRGNAVKLSAFQQAFKLIRDKANIHRVEIAHSDVRLQDLRHTFATNRVARWYEEGKDVQALLPVLSTYLGHCNLDSTAVYISFTNQLLDEASKRFQSYMIL